MIVKSNKNKGYTVEIFKMKAFGIGIVIDDTIKNKAMGISISEENWKKIVKSLLKTKLKEGE